MTSTADVTRKPWESLASWYYGLNPAVRLLLRWALITALVLVAFRKSLRNLVETTVAGGLVGYVWLLPIAGVLAALGVNLRRRPELPIHDRQTDIIVGTMGLGLALMMQGVLLPRYAEYFHLLRLDLLAMWLFVISSSFVLFGVRPVTRFGWVWVLLLLVFTLPYQVLVITLGGGRFAAGLGTLLIAAAATAISVGRNRERAVVGALAAFASGLVILIVMRAFVPRCSGAGLPANSRIERDLARGRCDVPVPAARRIQTTARPEGGTACGQAGLGRRAAGRRSGGGDRADPATHAAECDDNQRCRPIRTQPRSAAGRDVGVVDHRRDDVRRRTAVLRR
jgi:hypothetical protein